MLMGTAVAAERGHEPTLRLGFGFAVGSSPSRGFPALTADLFPVELQVPLQDTRSVAVQLDWAQPILESYLVSRRTLGLAAYHQWSVPMVKSLAAEAGVGLDTEWGLLAGSADGRRTRKPVVALGASTRLGGSYGGGGGRFRHALYLRGTLGRGFEPTERPMFARALVETTLTWGVR